jgi:meso-butanediol dehydrogenase / (S,S)-butanediol dehydrogenase / diacetyl reductase
MNDSGKTRHAVVTGSSGIGLGTAQRLARDGFSVTICGIDDTVNGRARAACAGLAVEVVKLDVSDEPAVAAFAADLAGRIDGLDALVNAAGIQTYGTIETTTPADWQRTIAVNLTSCYLMSHFLYPLMKKRGEGSIVHIASVQGHSNQNKVLAYATAKGAIHTLTRAMAVDCARDGIRVNSVSPGSVRTPLLEFSAHSLTPHGGSMEETLAAFGKAHPVGRVGTVEEVAALISYLVGPESRFCTGGDFLIDGGLKAQLGV